MKTFTGIVIKHTHTKTAVVEVTRSWTHPKYKKTVKRTKKYQVHDPQNRAQTGDTVIFKECRPISKYKRFMLESIVPVHQA